MSLSQRLVLGALAVVSVLVAAVVALVDRRLERRLIDETYQQLRREAALVASTWQGRPDADSIADAAGVALGHRVTLIAPDGRVVGDSEFDGDALARLESHAGRPEVAEALRRGVGMDRRTSASTGDNRFYAAVSTPAGVARVSIATRNLQRIVGRAERDVLIAGLAAMAVAMLLALLFSRSVSAPIVELRDVARSLAAGDLTRRPALAAPGEIGDLADALSRMADELAGRLQALQAEDALTNAILEALNEGVLAVDAQRRVVRLNESARRLLRLRDPVPFSLDALPRDRTLRELLDAALKGEPGGQDEMQLASRTLVLTVRPLDRGGAVLAILDLTRQRRLETIRRDFVANVSHELKTPLTVIQGFAETLAEEELPDETRRRFAGTVRANARRMHRIVDDLLDLSRIESGGWIPNRRVNDLEAAAADAMQSVLAAAAARGVTLDTAIDPDAAAVYADPTALRQILANLTENAVRYTPAGGSATIVSERGDGGVWVGVRDTGIGIAAEHLPRIFERFYRVDPGRSREEGGTGLGLAIVRHLAEAHGGRTRADSAPGLGTTIEVFFPDSGATAT